MHIYKLAIVATILGILSGCSNVDLKMADGIREGQKQYSRGNFIGAERILSGSISMDPKNPAAAEAYYIRGLARLKLLKHSTAGQDFQRALRIADREDLRANAHVCLGSIAYELGDWDIAYQHYKAAEENLPHLSPSDWILFRLASSAQRSGRWDEGKKYYARILLEFPESETAKGARRNMNYGYYAIQVGAFSTAQSAFARVYQLKRAGVTAKVYPITTAEGRSLKGVYVGRYNDYYQAGKGLVKIRKIIPEARIVP
ncbi:MAG: tetratricopeptide repeat protein [Phycisphaerae bacterium]